MIVSLVGPPVLSGVDLYTCGEIIYTASIAMKTILFLYWLYPYLGFATVFLLQVAFRLVENVGGRVSFASSVFSILKGRLSIREAHS